MHLLNAFGSFPRTLECKLLLTIFSLTTSMLLSKGNVGSAGPFCLAGSSSADRTGTFGQPVIGSTKLWPSKETECECLKDWFKVYRDEDDSISYLVQEKTKIITPT